ncbi:MAG: ATP-binding protein [Deltaproteobacteria bacterium]|nr:ATP-binding protein [Deltaproteobacteria bacterium]
MSNPVDLSKVYNPYDFSNPVSDEELFVGRKRQLEAIDYYLDQARLAPRAMNLALIGRRAAGKTSLLNMTELHARKRGFCVARVDLNESDAESPLAFFFKVFDSVFAAAVDFTPEGADGKCFGGEAGKTYQAYLDMVSAYKVPDDPLFCPFVFPTQYARAMAASQQKARLSESILQKDLKRMSAEAHAPIAILIDECNVLSGNRVILQMIRNVFMNLPGYMLVFVGTPDLFPEMDAVFSPVMRQFKRIDVGPLASVNDTASCLRKPLLGIGLDEDLLEDYTIKIAHAASGGNPYLIRLIGHFMFRGLSAVDSKMTLTKLVLDDVVDELEGQRAATSFSLGEKLKALTDAEIRALAFFSPCREGIDFDSLWVIENVCNGETVWRRDDLVEICSKFERLGLLENKGGRIRFLGDELMWTLVFLRSQDLNRLEKEARVRDGSIFFEPGQWSFVDEDAHQRRFPTWDVSETDYALNRILRQLEGVSGVEALKVTRAAMECLRDFRQFAFTSSDSRKGEDRSIADKPFVYRCWIAMQTFTANDEFMVGELTFELPSALSSGPVLVSGYKDEIVDCVEIIQQMRERASCLKDLRFDFKFESVKPPKAQDVVSFLSKKCGERARQSLAEQHYVMVGPAFFLMFGRRDEGWVIHGKTGNPVYAEVPVNEWLPANAKLAERIYEDALDFLSHAKECSLANGRFMCELLPSPPWNWLCDYGFACLIAFQLDEAEGLFKRAIEAAPAPELLVPQYFLGLVKIMRDDLPAAIEILGRIVEETSGKEIPKIMNQRLLLLIEADGRLDLKFAARTDFREAAARALEILKRRCGSPQ